MKLSEVMELNQEYKFTVWNNIKTNTEYLILNIAYDATNNRELKLSSLEGIQ